MSIETRTITQVKISSLYTHPLQEDIFCETSESALEELADDIKKNGLQIPIEILKDGTIICGHRRVQAMLENGETKIPAIIRDDLGDDANDPVVINRLVNDNLQRRNLDDLELARCCKVMKESGLLPDSKGDIRDFIAALIGCGLSGRSLDRLVRLLDLPREIQDMITRGELNKSQGAKILALPEQEREALIASLLADEPVEDVLIQYGIIRESSEQTPEDVAKNLLGFLKQHVCMLHENIASLNQVQVRGGTASEVIYQTIEFLTEWHAHKTELHQMSVDDTSELIT